MVTKRIRTEYMKRFKDPKWETYSKCYEEMLNYRLARRLLEHTHNPWFWNGFDSDSESSGSRSPPSKNQVEPGPDAQCEEVGADSKGKSRGGPPETSVLVPKIHLPHEDEGKGTPQTSAANGKGAEGPDAGETRVLDEETEEEEEEERAEQRANSSRGSKRLTPLQREQQRGGDATPPEHQQTKPSKPHWHGLLARPREDKKQTRHPFALYGWAERQADMAGRKTHNVCPVTSTNEIHESALRAKTRREVEQQIQTRRSERRRAKSADLDQIRRTKVAPEFNPWLTEYMRCFSAHSR